MTTQVEGYRISVQQLRQLRLWRLRGGGCPAWAQLLLTVDGPLDPARLEASLLAVVADYDILRTTYRPAPGQHTAVQVVGDDAASCVAWTHRDLRHLDGTGQNEAIGATVRAGRRPVDVERGPVLSATRFQLTGGRHALLIATSALTADRDTLRWWWRAT